MLGDAIQFFFPIILHVLVENTLIFYVLSESKMSFEYLNQTTISRSIDAKLFLFALKCSAKRSARTCPRQFVGNLGITVGSFSDLGRPIDTETYVSSKPLNFDATLYSARQKYLIEQLQTSTIPILVT